MSRPLAVFDIDGTIFRSSLLIEVTNALIEDGVFDRSIEKVYAKQYTAWRNREASYDHYINKVVEAFSANLKNVPVAKLQATADIVIGTSGKEIYRYTRDLIKSLQKTHFLIAISKSPELLVKRFAESYGFDDYDSSVYESENGVYSGNSLTEGRHKDVILHEMVATHGLSLKGSIGVGDSEGDIPFLSLVEHPIAFNPNSLLFAEAMDKDWQVVVERKDVIYYYNKPDHVVG